MNQGKIVVAVAVVLGICAGLAGYWWNYRIGHRALAFWGQENARLIRLAPKVEYLELELKQDDLIIVPGSLRPLEVTSSYAITKTVDISQARGLIHLRNAILSDDQYNWDFVYEFIGDKLIALRFTDQLGKKVTIYFNTEPRIESAFLDLDKPNESVNSARSPNLWNNSSPANCPGRNLELWKNNPSSNFSRCWQEQECRKKPKDAHLSIACRDEFQTNHYLRNIATVLIAGLAFLWYQRWLNQRAVEFWGTSRTDLIQMRLNLIRMS